MGGVYYERIDKGENIVKTLETLHKGIKYNFT